MDPNRRSVLTTFGLAIPVGLFGRPRAFATPPDGATLRLRPFEQAVRDAFAASVPVAPPGSPPRRRVEIGPCDLLRLGIQGCCNDRPFAGFPAGHLRIVQAGSEPGPVVGGVRLYVSTVELTAGGRYDGPGRPLNFATLPPAPVIVPTTNA